MVENISLDYLKVFFEVAKHKNLTKAAEKLFISQPAISQTLNKIEEQLEVKLLIRNNKGIVLTEIGSRIFEKLNNAFLEIGSINELLESDKELSRGVLRIGCGTNLARISLVEPLKNFHVKYPKVQISQIEDNQINMMKLLLMGELDVFISQRNVEFEEVSTFTKLFDEKFVFVCSKKYLAKLSQDNEITYIVQHEGSYNRKTFDEYIKSRQIKYQSLIQVVGYNMALELALSGLGIALIPSYRTEPYIMKNELVNIQNDFKFLSIEYGYYINPKNKTRALERFLEFL